VSHYEVSGSVPQSVVLACGVGRPTKDVTLVSRDLTPKEPDQILKIDLSSLPEERFPAVAWLYQRRSFAWKTTGGYLPPVALRPVPPRVELKLSKVKRNEAIPHVIPLLFTGPRASAGPGSFRRRRPRGAGRGRDGQRPDPGRAVARGRLPRGLTQNMAEHRRPGCRGRRLERDLRVHQLAAPHAGNRIGAGRQAPRPREFTISRTGRVRPVRAGSSGQRPRRVRVPPGGAPSTHRRDGPTTAAERDVRSENGGRRETRGPGGRDVLQRRRRDRSPPSGPARSG
jgi:hypothetical protein